MLANLTGKTDWEQVYFIQRHEREIADSTELLRTNQHDLLLERYLPSHNDRVEGSVSTALFMKALAAQTNEEKVKLYDLILDHESFDTMGTPTPSFALALCGKAEMAKDNAEKLKYYKRLFSRTYHADFINPFVFPFLSQAVKAATPIETDVQTYSDDLDRLLVKISPYSQIGFADTAMASLLCARMTLENDELEKAALRAEIIETFGSSHDPELRDAVKTATRDDPLPWHFWFLHDSWL